MKSSEEIRQSYLDFWSESPRNSKVIPNSSLVPSNVQGGNTLLFVNSGMFPIIPYLTGQPHPLGTRVHNVQRCIRTKDIEDVGDNRHLVLFEMIGNWSFGDFTKEQQIEWCLELYVKRFGLDPKRLYITVWAGDEVVPRDDEAIRLWQREFKKYGINAEFSEDIGNIPSNLKEGEEWKYRIFPYGREANWWEVSHSAGEPGGPSSEIFYDLGVKEREQDQYHINDDSGRFIEVGNNVFMEYKLDENLKYQPLEKKNIDFGGGFDRIMFAVQNQVDVFATDLFQPMIEKIENLSNKQYKGGVELNEDTKAFRIVAEHIRSSVFILGDGVIPSGKDQGYILRRLIRRMVRYAKKLGIENNFSKDIALIVINKMQEAYPHLAENKDLILSEIEKEEKTFRITLDRGLRILKTHNYASQDASQNESQETKINGAEAFNLYETYGFPLELTLDELKIDEKTAEKITEEFKSEEKKHRESSRAGAEQKFKGGLADQSIETTKLHTAHHLLLAALQRIVDPKIRQKGSNITAERLRIDFNLDRKLTEDEIKQAEDLVNEQITKELEVRRVEMPKTQAEQIGAQMEFGQNYPDTVSVYFMAPKSVIEGEEWQSPEIFSKEFCGGPHVSNTKELGENGKKFKILKEESSGSGVRRIKAALI
ncbi:MAG: alanine--tRNA ligase [Candidatus Dojkabacteria bacterium]